MICIKAAEEPRQIQVFGWRLDINACRNINNALKSLEKQAERLLLCQTRNCVSVLASTVPCLETVLFPFQMSSPFLEHSCHRLLFCID